MQNFGPGASYSFRGGAGAEPAPVSDPFLDPVNFPLGISSWARFCGHCFPASANFYKHFPKIFQPKVFLPFFLVQNFPNTLAFSLPTFPLFSSPKKRNVSNYRKSKTQRHHLQFYNYYFP